MTASSQRFVAILLIILGICGVALGLWRLAVWGFGTPEQLLWISPQAMELTAEHIDQRIARQERAVEKSRDAGLEEKAQAASATLEEMRAGREEWVREGDRALARAWWKELSLGLGLLIGGGLMIADGWRRLREGKR